MPRTKKEVEKKSTAKKAPSQRGQQKSISKLVTESYISVIYGAVTLVVLFALIFAGVRNFTHRKATQDIAKDGAATVREDKRSTQKVVVVQPGESLWVIAAREYNDGHKWVVIAQANNMSAPYIVERGAKLIIPAQPQDTVVAVVVTRPTATPTPTVVMLSPTPAPEITVAKTPTPTITTTPEKSDQNQAMITRGRIDGTSYTVQKGDYLWDIAVRAYGDGYRWVDIARANNLSNPDIIHSGNVFAIPRKG